MIASISGTLQRIGDESLIIRVGGVGIEVYIPSGLFSKVGQVGEVVDLDTFLVVREDSLTLYGFASYQERQIFEMLMGVSGVGPRLALAILSTLTPEMLASAVQSENPDMLTHVPGIGKKTAQRMLLDLKGKLVPTTAVPGASPVSVLDTEVIDALTALGYSIVEAQTALQSIPSDAPEDVEERVRLALQYFYG